VTDQLAPDQVKHLEMLQVVIARLASDSFLVKGWALALSSALVGFAINGEKWQLALLALLPTFSLWMLDTYFLRAERLFRALYDAVRTGRPKVDPFFMGATSQSFIDSLAETQTTMSRRWRTVAFSVTLCWFYALLGLISIGVTLLLGCG